MPREMIFNCYAIIPLIYVKQKSYIPLICCLLKNVCNMFIFYEGNDIRLFYIWLSLFLYLIMWLIFKNGLSTSSTSKKLTLLESQSTQLNRNNTWTENQNVFQQGDKVWWKAIVSSIVLTLFCRTSNESCGIL